MKKPVIITNVLIQQVNLRVKNTIVTFKLFRIFFSDNTRVRIFIFFCRAKRDFFSPEFNIWLYDKHWIRLFFFFSTKIRIFFRKNPYPSPLQVKWSFPYHDEYASFPQAVRRRAINHANHMVPSINHMPIYNCSEFTIQYQNHDYNIFMVT